MNNIKNEMPSVSRCEVTLCAYNTEQGCRAQAITIGEGAFPSCDTFLGGVDGGLSSERTAGVGACKVSGCKFNEGLGCQAAAIAVTAAGAPPACTTFAN